jgi:hypothetical protein
MRFIGNHDFVHRLDDMPVLLPATGHSASCGLLLTLGNAVFKPIAETLLPNPWHRGLYRTGISAAQTVLRDLLGVVHVESVKAVASAQELTDESLIRSSLLLLGRVQIACQDKEHEHTFFGNKIRPCA